MTDKNRYGKYECSYCGREFVHPQEADACRDSHNLIYIALSAEDLNRLLMFIQLKNEELITPTLWKAINKRRSYNEKDNNY
jgi:hypothetical protein